MGGLLKNDQMGGGSATRFQREVYGAWVVGDVNNLKMITMMKGKAQKSADSLARSFWTTAKKLT